jgi:drug/metabolite transporter (DMT)-like permease
MACGLIWGASQMLGKIAVSTGHGAFGLIFWQLVIGAAVLAPFSTRLRVGRRQAVWAAAIAVLGTLVPNTTFYISVERLPAGIMSIIIAIVPILAFPIAIAMGMDRASLPRLAGLLCGIAGVALIALSGGGLAGASLPQAEMAAFLPLALIGPLCYAIEGNVVARTGMAGMTAVEALFLVSALGAVMILPVTLATGQWIDPRGPWGRAEGALVLSSVGHAFAYAAYVWLAARAGAVFSSQVSYIVTASGVLWAMAILGERYAPTVWAAFVVMLAGLALVTPRRRERPGA